MKWIFVALVVLSSTLGDVLSAKGMKREEEVESLGPQGLLRVLHDIVTQPLVLIGILNNAISFCSFLALLSVAELSFAAPATAAAYILKVLLAKWYLGECVTWRRWAGALLVGIGVTLVLL